MRIIDTIQGEGFTATILENPDSKVEYVADGDVDADGANGQNGARPAYTTRNDGSELLGNGGMGIRSGKVIGIASWYRDIVVLGADDHPRVYPNGLIVSKTAYQYPNTRNDDPAAYVDSETVPYIVVPPVIIQKTAGAVLGCRARATIIGTGQSAEGIVADVGPRNRTGELSIEMARRLGLDPNPRSGGTEKPVILYELWPGMPGKVDNKIVTLRRSNGTYVV